MPPDTIKLRDNLIAYSDDKRAGPVAWSLAELGAAEHDCTLGFIEFSDDDSVHAGYWECHPGGDEILCVVEGCLLATVDRKGVIEEVSIASGEACIVPRASWHRLRVLEPGRMLFFTPRAGTALRPHAPEPS